jgi:phosphate:Na+ symporter
MSPLNALIFGLGLFFLGLQLVGENLRRLSGSGFRTVIKRGTSHPALAAGLGLVAGAVMQSATAVTFILVGMTGTGLVKARAAAPIVLWCNVGLTALAFVSTFNIHPVAAFVVGGAGIVLGTIRVPFWQTLAGALLGLGLILIGLEQMGAGAAPLKNAGWFRDALSAALASPPLTFLAGIAAAAILQSNTGAAMLVITFAANGLISLESAMLLLYGTNLGAIGLRVFLAAGLQGDQLRLVRLEDLFCVISGALMVVLFVIEQAGVPLIGALVRALSPEMDLQLAMVFFLSNALPAVAVTAALPGCLALLKSLWPDRPAADDPSRPQFLRSHALDDPPTALDLLGRELARLLGLVRAEAPKSETVDEPEANFAALALAIETFATRLASRGTLNDRLAGALHLRRAELSIIRHIEESVRYFAGAASRQDGPTELTDRLRDLLGLAVRAAETGEAAAIEELDRRTKLKGPEMRDLEKSLGTNSLTATAVFEDFAIPVWTIHRLAKVLRRLPA